MSRSLILLSLILIFPFILFSQSGDVSFSACPRISVPLGPELDNGTALYTFGGGLSLEGAYRPERFSYVTTGALADFLLQPVNGTDQNATFISIAPQIGLSLNPLPRLAVGMHGYGGLYMGIIEKGSIRDPFYGIGVSADYRLNPGVSLSLNADYRDYLTSGESALKSLNIGIGARYLTGSSSRSADLLFIPRLDPIFPLFFSYYDTNPAGSITLINNEAVPLKDVAISFYIKQFMDQPKLCAEYKAAAKGSEIEVPVYALFSEDIFRVTEGTKVAGEFRIDYTYIGSRMTRTVPVTVTVHNRNAMTWDDDRKAAAFVTAKDPLVLSFAKNVAATVGADVSSAINEKFRTAFGIYEALTVYGMGYVVDPATPYSALSEQISAVDYLQFPNQSLAYKAGDCDDLSILYTSLLEAVGIKTAFITAPGHIYMAFSPGIHPAQAAKLFSEEQDLIFRGDETWIPVEITLVREGFLKSWQIGAKQWRETSRNGTAAFYPVGEAWELYEPIGFSEGSTTVVLPSEDRLMARYRKELAAFVDRQIEPRIKKLQGELATTSDKLVTRNKLGILYARFGVLDKAAEQFSIILKSSEYVPALVNLGNIAYMQGEMERAYDYYTRALASVPGNPAALLGTARTTYALERYAETDESLRQLRNTDPSLAEEFAYLGSGSGDTARASQAVKREIDIWEEE